MAKDLAKRFVHHREVAPGSNRIPELPFNHAKRAFDVAPFVVMGEVFLFFELEIMEHLLVHSADAAGRVLLESCEKPFRHKMNASENGTDGI